MPDFIVRFGHKLVVSDPEHPGQTLDKLSGDVVTLTTEQAEQYADALDAVVDAAHHDAEQ